ncbi:MAG: DUF1697 domain-containing protein, partial [Thermomicrobiales bacterium]
MPTYLALLRAVNVSGHNLVPMKELRARMEAAGYTNVRTYIQSGNVIFDHPSTNESELRSALAELITTEFNAKSPVVLRNREELAETIANCPFTIDAGEEKLFHVMFLGNLPNDEQLAALDPNRSPLDKWQVRGRDIYVHYASGIAGTKLTNSYFDSKLKTVSTGRNWRTVNTPL